MFWRRMMVKEGRAYQKDENLGLPCDTLLFIHRLHACHIIIHNRSPPLAPKQTYQSICRDEICSHDSLSC